MDQNDLIVYLDDYTNGFDKGCLKIQRKIYFNKFRL